MIINKKIKKNKKNKKIKSISGLGTGTIIALTITAIFLFSIFFYLIIYSSNSNRKGNYSGSTGSSSSGSASSGSSGSTTGISASSVNYSKNNYPISSASNTYYSSLNPISTSTFKNSKNKTINNNSFKINTQAPYGSTLNPNPIFNSYQVADILDYLKKSKIYDQNKIEKVFKDSKIYKIKIYNYKNKNKQDYEKYFNEFHLFNFKFLLINLVKNEIEKLKYSLNTENDFKNFIEDVINNFYNQILQYKKEDTEFNKKISNIINLQYFDDILNKINKFDEKQIKNDIINELIANNMNLERYEPTSANKEYNINTDNSIVFYLDKDDNFIGISEFYIDGNKFSMMRPIKNFFCKEKQFGLKFILIMNYLKIISNSTDWETQAEPVGGMKKYLFRNDSEPGFINNKNKIIEKRLRNFINSL